MLKEPASTTGSAAATVKAVLELVQFDEGLHSRLRVEVTLTLYELPVLIGLDEVLVVYQLTVPEFVDAVSVDEPEPQTEDGEADELDTTATFSQLRLYMQKNYLMSMLSCISTM